MSSLSLPAPDGGRIARFNGFLPRAASALVILLPLALFYSRAAGDALMTLTAVGFLWSRAAERDWQWLKPAWTRIGLLLWAWMVVCSIVQAGGPAVVQAVVSVRFFVFVAALETWVLRDPETRLNLRTSLLVMLAWLFIELLQQQLTGHNAFGVPRYGDGALTGPFTRPRAGGTFQVLFFPVVLPWVLFLSLRSGWLDRFGALALSALGSATIILIGQRMPAVLFVLGLCAAGVLFRQFRVPLLVSVALGAGLLLLMPVVSPLAFAKLVVRFADQLQHFWGTAYGLIFARSVAMVQAHPWLGLGWDGFRNFCDDPAYLQGVSWLPVSDPASPEGCTIHPHSYWMQVATTAGLPGVALFAALVGTWLWRVAGGGAYAFNPQRGALLVSLFVAMWPIASTTSLFTVPNAGWIFLLAGWALAEARFSGDALRRPVFGTPRYTSALWPNLVP